MMRIEEGEAKLIWLPHHLIHLLMPQMLLQMLLVKEERRAKESQRVEEKERRGLYVRNICLTKDVLKEINVLMLTPERLVNV